MLILALDTTTRASSCAVARGAVVLREEAGDASRDTASRMPADLMTLLAHANITLPEIEAFCVAIGPGYFTGLRIGIATMHGLSFAMGKPLIGVSGFDALARIGGAGRIATWVDAWRGEVYAALYDNECLVEPPVVAHPGDLLRDLAGRPTLFIGDGAGTYQDLIRQTMPADARVADPAAPPLAGALARLAADVAHAFVVRGESLPGPDAIRPLYVRRTDAELARDRR
jgi:tRNA threonylcarbamoyladenosine biosynthesis protein TsaB